MIRELSNNGAMPALERLVQFTEARQSVLANNVANLSTPNFRPRDLDVKAFQAALGEAIDRRRGHDAPSAMPLRPEDTRDLEFHPNRIVPVDPQPTDENVLFHDANNRDLDRIMQDVAENVMAHQFGVNLLKNQFDLLKTAIRERL